MQNTQWLRKSVNNKELKEGNIINDSQQGVMKDISSQLGRSNFKLVALLLLGLEVGF